MSGAGGTQGRYQPSRRPQIDVDVDSSSAHHSHIPSASASQPPHALPSLSATPGANTSSKTTTSPNQSRSRMPAIGAPAFYDPDAPPHPQPTIDYATFMMQQQAHHQAQQQQQHHQGQHGQMGYAGHAQSDYGIDAGGYGYDGLEGMDGLPVDVNVNVGFGAFAPPHQQHQQQHQQTYGHPSAHAHQPHALHQHPAHQYSSVSPASGSTHSLPSGGGSGPGSTTGAGAGGYFNEGYDYQGQAGHQQQQQQQQQQFPHALPEHNFDMYFPPPSAGAGASAGTGFGSFPSSAGAGTPPVPLWNTTVGEVSGGLGEIGQMQGQGQGQGQGQAQIAQTQGGGQARAGQGQKERWGRSTAAMGAGANANVDGQKRPGRSGTVRAAPQQQTSAASAAQQKQSQSQAQVQAQKSKTSNPGGGGGGASNTAAASRRKNRAKRARINPDGSDGSEDESEDELGAAASQTTQTGGPTPNLFGTSFPSWSSGMGGTFGSAHSGAGAGGGGGGAGQWAGLGGIPGLAGLVGGQNARLPGACTHCKKLKMKCEFPQGDNVCKRCKAGGHACVVEGRKPRSAPNKREYLLAQIRQKDAIIESLLKQLHNPYMATPLSIAAYRMASSPSDVNGSRNVIQWLERLQQSAQNQAGAGSGGRAARTLERHARRRQAGVDGEELSDSEGDLEEQEHDPADGVDASLLSPPRADTDATAVSETLKQNDSLPDDAVPIGLLANLSISNHAGRAKERSRTRSEHSNGHGGGSAMGSAKDFESEGDDDTNVGVANETYFLPGPASDLHVRKMLIERHSPPEILVHGLVNAEDVEKLFEIFYEKVNPFLSLLDPVLHTPASTFARCPFLFTVVCAISSRYYREKAEIYAIAMHFAKHAAATALIDGWKSVELCQAYILMAVYAVPARRWEEDRSWLYIGLAIRLATDLNLHQAGSTKPTSEQHEREILNRTRVWMICFNLDRSTATQFGKPSTIKEDYKQLSIIRNSKDWYKRSKYNHPYDVHLCAYSSLLRIVAAFHEEMYSDKDSPSGLNQSSDFKEIIQRHDAILEDYFVEWTQRFNDDSDPEDNACKFRATLLPFLTNYSRLVMYSFGFQQAFRRGFQADDELFFNKCMDSASNVIKCVIDVLAPSGYFRYAPDGHFVFASFASAFLLKLLRPEFLNFVTREQTNQIYALIGKLIQVLASSEVSIDDRHTPKLYARFLAGLLAKHQPGGSSSGRLHPSRPSDNQMPDSDGHGAPGPMHQGGGPSQTVFHVNTSSQGGTSPQHGTQHALATSSHSGVPELVSHQALPSPLSMSSTSMDTPIYEAEATYAIGTGPLELTSSDGLQFGMGGSFGYGAMQDEEMLAAMHAIKNPAFWDNMMMPGFMWPDTARVPHFQHQQNGILGLNSGPMPQQMPLHT